MEQDKRNSIPLVIVGVFVFAVIMFPLYWMLVTSLKTQLEIFSIPTPLWPQNLTFEAYWKQLAVSGDTLQGFRNSLIIALGAAAIATVLAIPAAYGLARFRFRLRKAIILAFLITQMLPSTLVLTSL
jgi:multiple sugar transport system permease protein